MVQVMQFIVHVIYYIYAFLQCVLNANNSKIDCSLVSQNKNEKIVTTGASYIHNVDIVKLCHGVV